MLVYTKLLCAFAALLATSVVARANLITNPGLEAGTAGWVITSPDVTSGVYVDPLLAHSGSSGAIINSRDMPAPGDSGSFSQAVVLPGPGTYEFGAWVRFFTIGSPVGDFDVGQVSLSTGANTVTVGTTPNAVGVANFTANGQVYMSSWLLLHAFFTYAGSGPQVAQFTVSLLNNVSNNITALAFDDAFVVPLPPSLVLMLTAFFGIGLASSFTRSRYRSS